MDEGVGCNEKVNDQPTPPVSKRKDQPEDHKRQADCEGQGPGDGINLG